MGKPGIVSGGFCGLLGRQTPGPNSKSDRPDERPVGLRRHVAALGDFLDEMRGRSIAAPTVTECVPGGISAVERPRIEPIDIGPGNLVPVDRWCAGQASRKTQGEFAVV